MKKGLPLKTLKKVDKIKNDKNKEPVYVKPGIAVTLNEGKTLNGKKAKTGIHGFDVMINGGFEQNSINLIAGGAGSGKTIFAAQFILNGVLDFNEPGIYVTFEEKKEKFYKDMELIGYDMKKIEATGKFLFLEYTPEQVRNVLIEGGGIIDSMIEKIGARRLVIDSITSFSLLYEDELSKKEAALSLFDLINKWNCTALLTSQNESQEEKHIKVSLEFEVDSVILFYHIVQKGIRIRALEVLKMRRTKHSEKVVTMEITSKGIMINPNKIISDLL